MTESAAFVIKRFRADHYTAVFSPTSGFFARVEDAGRPEPFWSVHGPELLDVAVTSWCDRGCSVCYRGASRHGVHIALEDFEDILRQARKLHVFQVALGGGNPNQHPWFVDLLRLARVSYGIVPNYTTNGRGLTSAVLEASAAYCGAVAVSAYPPYRETADAVRLLRSQGITTNVHFVLTSKTIDIAMEWLKRPPPFLSEAQGLVFLNYKPVGRNVDPALALGCSDRLDSFFCLACSVRHEFRVGFDNCSAPGLARFGDIPPISREGCDAGRFSLFISERGEVYPCSFMLEAGYSGARLADRRLVDIWRTDGLFQWIRRRHAVSRCGPCSQWAHCLSGCPLFPDINPCPDARQQS